MNRREDEIGREGAAGPANTPAFGAEPRAVRSAADHQIAAAGGETGGASRSETERELERTRDLVAERAAPIMAEKAQEALTDVADRAMHDPEVKDQIRKTAAAAQHDAQRAAKERLGAIGLKAENRINEGMAGAAERIEEAASRLDRIADENLTGAEGARARAGEMAHSTADAMESVARYLRDNDARALREDLARQVRQRPIQTLLVGVAAGWVTGKILR
jgi:hypothetical protein